MGYAIAKDSSSVRRIENETDCLENEYYSDEPITIQLPVNSIAKQLLDKSDITMLRIQEAIAIGDTTWDNTDVVEWIKYRKELRSIITNNTGLIPNTPKYPENT